MRLSVRPQYNVELSPEVLAKFLGSIKKFLGFFTSSQAVAGSELSRGNAESPRFRVFRAQG